MDKETGPEKKKRPDLSDKKDLLLHQYDVFLTAQTRIFTLSRYVYDNPASEIKERQKTLFLDDILSFSISARRLIELTSLKTFSNSKAKVKLQGVDANQRPARFWPSTQHIGFLIFMSKIVHAQYVRLFLERLDPLLLKLSGPLSKQDIWFYTMLEGKLTQQNRWNEYAFAPILVVRSDTDSRPHIVVVRDLIDASIIVMEKVIKVCSHSEIFLETDMR
jgi:hypothetical protein